MTIELLDWLLPLLPFIGAVGIFGKIKDTLIGSDPEVKTPFLGKAPDFPFFGDAAGFLKRQQGLASDPFGSQQFQTFSRGIRDSGSVARRGVLEAIEESFGSDGGPGLQSGAAAKAKGAAALQVGQSIVSQERQFLNNLLERSDRSVLQLLDILGRFRASTFASETQAVVEPGGTGLFDVVSEGRSAVSGLPGIPAGI